MPVWALWALLPLWPLLHKALDLPPNLKETITAAHKVTYWAKDDKARRELGYSPRGLNEGLRLTLETEGYV